MQNHVPEKRLDRGVFYFTHRMRGTLVTFLHRQAACMARYRYISNRCISNQCISILQ
jgi:hypothetical protein